MDRALDDVITERQREDRSGRGRRGDGGRGGRGRRDEGRRDESRRDDWPRDGARKNGGGHSSNIDDEWIHDKYQDEDDAGSRGPRRGGRGRGFRERDSPEADLTARPVKLRVENLHYDLTEEDLDGLFNQVGAVVNLTLTYDRAGRSTGTAYVTYASISTARQAVAEFDGANAHGQPIRLSIIPSGPSGNAPRGSSARGGRNPFDTAIKPSRSLFDRVERSGSGRGGRDRSRSPRRTDTTKPVPDGIDRYVPGHRSRSPPRRRRPEGGARGGDGGGDRRGDGGRRGGGGGRRDDGGRGGTREGGRGARPKMTQEELDRDMDSYFNSTTDKGAADQPASAVVDDIEMAE